MESPKKVVRIGPFKDLIASGVRVGDIITLSGQIAIEPNGQIVGIDDVVAQLRRAYQNVKEVLDEFAAAPDRIVDETWFVTDVADVMANVASLIAARQEILGHTLADVSHTLVQVAGLVEPELRIEVKCIAHL